ncbi:MAG: signal peptide peptidase SppA [Planctomycetes bacterium]|nr:signal peptide peptidase SppA [Planctomycetota bacterium]
MAARTLRKSAWQTCAISALLVLACAGCAPVSFLITPVSGSRELQEHVVSRESAWADRKIALIDVDGVLSNMRESSMLGGIGDNPVARFKERLDHAASDAKVAALVLRINSPGGGVTASDLMYGELRRFREKTGKPIIASMLDTAASGGYYIACAADKIYACPTTVTGSIGVIMITPDLSGLMGRLGVEANVIKSGAMKDAGSPFRPMNDQDRTLYQNMINAMYERFLDVVAASRTRLTREQIRALADGRVYLAPAAKENGLIDEIGSLDQAIAAAKSAAGIAEKSVKVVQYALPHAHQPNIYAEAPGRGGDINLINVELPRWLHGASPEFLYLWSGN